MLGFLFGTACLIGLIKVLKGGHGFGWWRRTMLHRLFRRLDTTHGQEKVIFTALDSLETVFAKAREQARSSRSVAAESIRGEHFDSASLRDSFAKNASTLEELHRAVQEALQSVHEALRPEQRRELSELIAHGPRGYHGCSSHRCGSRSGAVHL